MPYLHEYGWITKRFINQLGEKERGHLFQLSSVVADHCSSKNLILSVDLACKRDEKSSRETRVQVSTLDDFGAVLEKLKN